MPSTCSIDGATGFHKPKEMPGWPQGPSASNKTAFYMNGYGFAMAAERLSIVASNQPLTSPSKKVMGAFCLLGACSRLTQLRDDVVDVYILMKVQVYLTGCSWRVCLSDQVIAVR